ncbi:hypothetical protein SSCG_05180 [Streptomyces clavuligerus]|nr:hypothetical protein SSCG_05180 [Streptomyces clavuligerus]
MPVPPGRVRTWRNGPVDRDSPGGTGPVGRGSPGRNGAYWPRAPAMATTANISTRTAAMIWFLVLEFTPRG